MLSELKNINFWKNNIIPNKTVIRIREEKYKVLSICKIDLQTNFNIHLIELEDNNYIFLKIEKNCFEIKILRKKKDIYFKEGTRESLLQRSIFFPFREPNDVEDFIPLELQFADKMNIVYLDKDDPCEIEYKQKTFSEGTASYSPPRREEEGEYIAAIEYESVSQNSKNLDFVFLAEFGGRKKTENGYDFDLSGGYIILYYGYDITKTMLVDIELYN